MINTISCNCIVCAEEFDPSELRNIVLSKINVTKFKICERCLAMSDPADDYNQAKVIVNSYLKNSDPTLLFKEAQELLESTKK